MSKKIITFRVMIIVILIGLSFDQYMKATWDHDILGEDYSKYLIKYSNGSTSDKDVENLEIFPSLFEKKLKIVKQNNQYIWDNHILYKSEVRYRRNKNWMSEQPNYEVEATIFENVDQSVVVRIASGGYIQTGCQPFNQEENVIVEYKLTNNKMLLAYTHVEVYDNIIAFFTCKNN